MVGPVVIVKQGWLRGTETKSVVGGSYLSFKGIPFAEAPVGDLRFKDPQPPQSWTGVREALKEGSKCLQADELTHEIMGDEDCLYLNVATTSLKGSRPVMVWIHGGGFMWGNGGSEFHGPDYLMKTDIVFVSINYRVGVLGFLSLEHEAAPGNMGLKDQVAGLKWVKENIAQFGGDPNNVTIFGESAGGASVHFHLLSPLSEGLFHKAIAQSGVALNPWAQVLKTTEFAHRLVAYLGKEITDPNEIVEYLRTIPVHKLGEAQENVLTPDENNFDNLPFGPCIDSKSIEPFLPRPLHELAAEVRDLPFMLGYNSHEGNISLGGCSDEIDEDIQTILSRDLAMFPPSKVPQIITEIKEFYFGDKEITKDMTEKFIQCTGDSCFVSGIHEVVDIRAKTKSPTYLYRFSYDSPKKLSKIYYGIEFEGTGHTDELSYLFYPTRYGDVCRLEPDSTGQLISERFIRMWTNFAKTGNPTPHIDDLITTKWEPVTRTTKNYLEINADLTAGVNPDDEMYQFWKRLRTTLDD